MTSAAPWAAATRAMSASIRRPVASFTMQAPAASAASATPALYVSMDSGSGTAVRSAASTGTTRASSASAESGGAPGRVDSPPTSSRSAPAAANA
jgi:hypothetical protein